MAITIHVDKLVGGTITITTGRNPAMTRLWWTTPRSGGMQSRDGGDYSDVAITGQLTQSSISNIDGHSRTSIVAVEIGNTVTSIGYQAFQYCSRLNSVTIPNSVTSIGEYAFYNCTSMTSVTIPNNVTSIGGYTFAYCSSLTSITIPTGITRINHNVFTYCTSLTSVTIPDSVTSIGDSAFSVCGRLTSVTIPNRVTSIGAYAFQDCGSLTSVTIPNSVTSIGTGVFQNCASLISLDLYSINVYTSPLNDVFFGSSIQELWVNATSSYVLSTAPVWGLGLDSYGNKFMMIVYCNDGTVVINGNEGSSNGNSGKTLVRYYDGQVKKLDVKGTLSSSYFSQDYSILSVDIGTNVNRIEDYCFYNMNGPQTVYVPISVNPSDIGMYSFCNPSISELYMIHVDTGTVLSMASYWGIGLDYNGNPSYTVVVYCSNGTVVINGGSALSDGSGSN